ncbi:MAG: class I SAM-dependent rRNA methyltransferase [Bacteroidetes bacterium]|nr:class I SAM-dependent rRNA methyltransferase [Bacteroidota bacterium]
MTKKAILKTGKEHSVLRGHPWIFSGAIASHDAKTPGEWIEVFTSRNEFLAAGHWSDGSIAIRILSREQIIPDATFWSSKLQNCLNVRKMLGLGEGQNTNTYRLVHGEGDGLPGLICDIYGTCAILQAHSYGMFHALPEIAKALEQVFDGKLTSIYSKSRASMHDTSIEDQFFLGNESSTIAHENGVPFQVDWTEGQKTGFFLDQRDNRNLLSHFAAGKSVLNTFCYTGGFSVFALKGGAIEVTSVDVSEKAIRMAEQNVAMQNFKNPNHVAVVADVSEYLKSQDKNWDIVILDPPAYAKNLKKKHSAVMGYKRLNALGMSKVAPGGLLFTFSCSQVIDQSLFENTITAAGIESGRNARILYRLGQGPDHPVNLYHPEGHYLKGLVLQID